MIQQEKVLNENILVTLRHFDIPIKQRAETKSNVLHEPRFLSVLENQQKIQAPPPPQM